MRRNRETTDQEVDLVRRTYGYSVEEARNVLARRLGQTNWFKGLEADDGARAAFQELTEVRNEAALKALWWAMRHFAWEDGVNIALSCRPRGPVVLNEGKILPADRERERNNRGQGSHQT